MTTHVALLMHGNDSIDGLCAQLQNAGYAAFSVDSTASLIESAIDHGVDVIVVDVIVVDVIVVDVKSRQEQETLLAIEACSRLDDIPIVLVVRNDDMAGVGASWSTRVDDVVVLPTSAMHFMARIDSLSRSAKMAAECRRRRDVLRDFGVKLDIASLIPATVVEASALVVGPTNQRQITTLKAFDGGMTIAFAGEASDVPGQLDRLRPDVILASPAMKVEERRWLFRRLGSTLGWCDIPLLMIADEQSVEMGEKAGRSDRLELLPASTPPAMAGCRLRSLVRQSRLRRTLRGMVDHIAASAIDAKTGVYDHSFFHHYTDASIDDHRRRGAALAIAVCSLRGLSAVNELWGYPSGDQVLANLAMNIACGCRTQDLVGRISGCQFAVHMSDMAAGDADAFSRRLAKTAMAGLDSLPEGLRRNVRVHIGLSHMMKRDVASTMIRRAAKSELRRQLEQAS